MQLYQARPSPFVRKALVLLHETGQTGDVELVEATPQPLKREDPSMAHNPLGKIPALTRPDGPAIYDSRVICRYLDERAGGVLYPANRIWETLTLEATADGMMDAAVLMIYEGRVRDEAHRSAEWLDAQWARITRALDALSGRWMSHLNGRLDMGQIAVACALGYLDFRHPDRGWRAGHDTLADWYSAFAEREAMQATRPDG